MDIRALAKDQLVIQKEIFTLARSMATHLFIFPWRVKEIALSVVQIGLGSLPIIAISTAFAGLVISNEVGRQMNQALHTVSMVPGFTGQFVLRELGVAIPALLVVSKVGASITAEIGSMKITEQIDALKLLRIQPVSYLVFPRWVACIISMVCLTMISIAITLGCSVLVAIARFNFTGLEYINTLRHFVGTSDLICALTKSVCFGAIIPLVACAYGFHCKGGAQGVGTATTNSVVTSTLIVIAVDFILTFVFSAIL